MRPRNYRVWKGQTQRAGRQGLAVHPVILLPQSPAQLFFFLPVQPGRPKATTTVCFLVTMRCYPLSLATMLPLNRALLLLLLALLVPTMLGT